MDCTCAKVCLYFLSLTNVRVVQNHLNAFNLIYDAYNFIIVIYKMVMFWEIYKYATEVLFLLIIN